MKRIITVLLFLTLAIPALSGQEAASNNAAPGGQNVPEQSPNGPPQRVRKQPERWRYDPAAKPGQDENCTPQGLKKLNPDDVNYGGLLATWRIALIQQTIEGVYFWTIMVLCGALFLALAYITFLVKQRHERLIIAADVVSQISNAYLDARERVFGLTAQYNAIVAEDNARIEKEEKEKQGNENAKIFGSDPSSRALQAISGAGSSAQSSSSNAGNRPTSAATQSQTSTTTSVDVFGDAAPQSHSTAVQDDASDSQEDDDPGLSPLEKANRFKSRYAVNKNGSGPRNSTDRVTNSDSQKENVTQTIQAGAAGETSDCAAALVEVSQPKESSLEEELRADLDQMKAELERTKTTLKAREQQIGNQRKVNRELLDEVATLREKTLAASNGAAE
jgi:hypothetical protein